MKLKMYQVDAFAKGPFTGNPAAVIILNEWLATDLMQQVAEENNLSETAFLVPTATGYHIRWFTPTVEVDLCGHATLASAFVLFSQGIVEGDLINLESKSGKLSVSISADILTLNFPTDDIKRLDKVPEGLVTAIGIAPEEIWTGRDDLLLIYSKDVRICELTPDFGKLAQIKARGVIVSAPGQEKYDFVSRGFFPQSGIDEDPATGSAHTTLMPYWSKRLNKAHLIAKQVSARGGYFECQDQGTRTLISGKCYMYMIGEIHL